MLKEVNILSEITKTIIELLDRKDRPSVSTLIYLFCGFIEILCFISCISPVHFSWSLIDKVKWDSNLKSNDMIVKITFWILILYFMMYIIREITVRVFEGESNSKLRIIYANIYTIDDIVELFASIISLVFMIAVFVQMYKTQNLFVSNKSCMIYAVIAIKSGGFIVGCFRRHNLKVIDKVIKKFPDFD